MVWRLRAGRNTRPCHDGDRGENDQRQRDAQRFHAARTSWPEEEWAIR